MLQKLSVVLACLLLLSVTPVIAQITTTIPIPMFCEGNFDCDEDVDGSDASMFKEDFGRSTFGNPCSYLNDCPAPWSPCPDGMLVCDWVCIDPMRDEANCGGCNVTCSGKCLGGVCQQGIPGPVPKTGQTTVHTPGDDGYFEQGVEWPSPRFTDNGDGTVTDNLTGLMWLQNANCINTNYPEFDTHEIPGDGLVTWQNALDFVEGINDGIYPDCEGNPPYDDWRLPNIKELLSLLDYGQYPALPSGHPFSNFQIAYYWSSTTCSNLIDNAFCLHFRHGDTNDISKSTPHYVWSVRNGHPGTITTTTTIGPLCDETTDCGEGNCCGYASGQELWSGNPLYCTSKFNETICFFCTSSSDCAYSTDNPCCCSECDDLGLGFPASICWHPTPCGIGCGGTCLP